MDSVFYIRWRDTYLHGFTASGSALWTSDLLDAIFLSKCRANKLIEAIPIINETVTGLVVEEYGGGNTEPDKPSLTDSFEEWQDRVGLVTKGHE